MTTDQDNEEIAVARAIEEDIIFGRFGPGERLREEAIAREKGASRHHVRSALMILERVGIVTRERHKGAHVRGYTAEQVRQLYEVREMLTRQAALKITLPVSARDIAAVRALQADYEAAIDSRSLPDIHATNDAFHVGFFGLCGNPYLVDMLKRAMDMTYVIRAADMGNFARLTEARAEHHSMIGLLAGTDSWALSELCVQHLRPSKQHYLNRLEREETEARGLRKPAQPEQAS
ncbi:GntR family transcriptional regulator [Roseinatronobacter sp. S2]|uniref:GntR family transcriptional regulator n=1 Tax=Roseinatronobacter sp. S2 TaxID=3035471 RepID=UPI00240EE0F4|nr:GntR family transcriptional regulator [Roseinatronobacter sp. S2]WFE77104.1 GntR family transcriptional regulator [Roseinatronobacter sp. S2]